MWWLLSKTLAFVKMAMNVKFLLSRGFLVREDPVAGHIFQGVFQWSQLRLYWTSVI